MQNLLCRKENGTKEKHTFFINALNAKLLWDCQKAEAKLKSPALNVKTALSKKLKGTIYVWICSGKYKYTDRGRKTGNRHQANYEAV